MCGFPRPAAKVGLHVSFRCQLYLVLCIPPVSSRRPEPLDQMCNVDVCACVHSYVWTPDLYSLCSANWPGADFRVPLRADFECGLQDYAITSANDSMGRWNWSLARPGISPGRPNFDNTLGHIQPGKNNALCLNHCGLLMQNIY